MKKILLGIFIVSVLLNVYCITERIKYKKQITIKDLFDVKQVDKQTGLDELKDKLFDIDPNIYKNKKYFLIQTWDTISCSFESKLIYMQMLDSIAYHYKKSNIEFIFASEMRNDEIEQYCKNQQINLQNIILVNGANDFISSLFFQKNYKQKEHPAQFIIDKQGNIIYYKTSKFSSTQKDTSLIHNLNKFN